MMNTLKAPFFILLFFLLSSCSDDDVVDPCGFFVSTSETLFFIASPNDPQEVFVIVQEQPMYGEQSDDLRNYLLTGVSICHQDELVDGSIVLILRIQPDGEPILKRVIGSRVHEKSYEPFVQKIEQMPYWTPGKQQDIPVLVQVNIGIKIENGKLIIP